MVKGYKSLKIKELDALAATIQRLCNEVYNGKLDNSTARCINEMIKTRLQLAKVVELEEQVEILQALLEQKEDEQRGEE